MSKLQDFVNAYLESARWSSTDVDPETGEDINLDDWEGELDVSVVQQAKKDAQAFLKQAGDMITERNAARAGHDFWLTRNGHGAGFWDGDWPEHGDELTEISKGFGELTLYIGDDGKIYG